MSDSVCISCRKPKANHTCQVCEETVCKKCVQLLEEDTFSFMEKVPEVLTHHSYCAPCFDENVVPALESYNEIMGRAKEVFVFFITQKKEVPYLKKAKEFYKIKDCPDRNETIMRMAFFAARDGYNALAEVVVESEKIRNGSYQTSNWGGVGIAVSIDGERLDRQDLRNRMYT